MSRQRAEEFFRVALVPIDDRENWRYEALDFQSPPPLPGEPRRVSILHDRNELERFLHDMSIDSIIAWLPYDAGGGTRATLVPAPPAEVILGLERARAAGLLASLTICSTVTNAAAGIAAAREWFRQQRESGRTP